MCAKINKTFIDRFIKIKLYPIAGVKVKKNNLKKTSKTANKNRGKSCERKLWERQPLKSG